MDAWCVQAAVVEKPEEPQGVGGFERVSYSNPLGRRSVTAQAQVSTCLLFHYSKVGSGIVFCWQPYLRPVLFPGCSLALNAAHTFPCISSGLGQAAHELHRPLGV